MSNADFIIPVEIDGVVHQVRGRGRWGGGWCLHSAPQVPPKWNFDRWGMPKAQRKCETQGYLVSRGWSQTSRPTELWGPLAPLAPTARDPVQVIQDRLWCWPACSPLLGSGAGALQLWGERANLGSCIWINKTKVEKGLGISDSH